jgi:ankyrin repeat protein
VNRISIVFVTIIFSGFLIACERVITAQDLVGSWLVDDAAVDEFIAEARAGVQDKNEESAMNVIEPMLRRMAGKQRIEFTATELIENVASKTYSSEYKVVSIVGRDITMLIGDREFIATINGDMLVLVVKGGNRPIPYRKLSNSEVVAFKEKLERAKREPGPDASLHKRMMWVINAEEGKAAQYIEKYPDMLTQRNSNADTLLHNAVRYGKVDLVKLLLSEGADVNAANKFKDTPLFVAMSEFESTPELMDLLIDADASLEYRGRMGYAPLDYAVEENNLALARYLLNKGASVDARKKPEDMTPFMRSIYKSKVEMAQLLLDKGADLNAWSHAGNALFIATRFSSHETLQFLLDKGMAPNQPTPGGRTTALNYIQFREDGRIKATRQLVAAGADINASPLHSVLNDAIRREDVEWVRALLDMGANLQTKSIFYMSSLEMARKFGNAEIVSLIQAAGG